MPEISPAGAAHAHVVPLWYRTRPLTAPAAVVPHDVPFQPNKAPAAGAVLLTVRPRRPTTVCDRDEPLRSPENEAPTVPNSYWNGPEVLTLIVPLTAIARIATVDPYPIHISEREAAHDSAHRAVVPLLPSCVT